MCKVARRPTFGRAWISMSCMLAAAVLHVSQPEPSPSDDSAPSWDLARVGDHNSVVQANKRCTLETTQAPHRAGLL